MTTCLPDHRLFVGGAAMTCYFRETEGNCVGAGQYNKVQEIMRGLIGDRLLKRFLGNILHPPEFNQLRVPGSRSDTDETTNPSETTREKAQSRTPDPGDEMTDASASEDWNLSTNGNATSDKLGSSTDAAIPLS
jgi:hypothetical protein